MILADNLFGICTIFFNWKGLVLKAKFNIYQVRVICYACSICMKTVFNAYQYFHVCGLYHGSLYEQAKWRPKLRQIFVNTHYTLTRTGSDWYPLCRKSISIRLGKCPGKDKYETKYILKYIAKTSLQYIREK